MLTKDFIKAVKELGYRVDNEWPHTLYVETNEGVPDIVVAISKRKSDPPSWHGCTLIPASDAVALVKLVKEYESTPLEERVAEEEKELSIEDLNDKLVEEYILRKVSPVGLAKLMEKMLERHGYKDLQFNINYQGTTQSTIPKPY